MIKKIMKTPLIVILLIVFPISIGLTQNHGAKIAFFAEHEGGLHIFDFDTRKIDRLDVGISNIGNLDFLSGKNLLAFEGSNGHDVPRSIYIYDFNSKQKERVYHSTSYSDCIYRPQFHPSGQYLFALNYGTGIFKYSFSNKKWKKVEVMNTPHHNFQGISFSKSGNRVAISFGRFKGFLIASIENDRFIVEDYILEEFDSCICPRWFDENTICFAGRKVPGLQYVWKYSLKDKTLLQLTNEPIGARDFITLSRDGKAVVFTGTDKNFEWCLWKVSSDGNNVEKLTHSGNLSSHLSPVWIE